MDNISFNLIFPISETMLTKDLILPHFMLKVMFLFRIYLHFA